MVTRGCCCWYGLRAAAKNGASNIDPALVRVGLWPPGPVLATATADAEVPVVVVLDHAPTARRMIAAAATQMTRWWCGMPQRGRWPDIVAPLLGGSGAG
jgi:hypothetical protein